MKRVWNSWLRESCFIHCLIYTFVTIVNSVAFLMQGVREDPSGNWHELTRAAIVLIGVLAYELARKLPVGNVLLRVVIVYVITMSCVFGLVWASQFIEPLAESAYRDIFVNYTGLFVTVSVIGLILQRVRNSRKAS